MSPIVQLIFVGLLAAVMMCFGWQWQRRRDNAGIVDVLWAGGLAGSAVLLSLLGARIGRAARDARVVRRPVGYAPRPALVAAPALGARGWPLPPAA